MLLHGVHPCGYMQLEKALSSEQRRSDFTPRDDAVSFNKPTGACMLATAMLGALNRAARDCLEGSNLSSFLAEVSSLLLQSLRCVVTVLC